MARRLTDTIAELVTSDQLERFGRALGTTPATARSALRGSVAALLDGLADLVTPAGGTTRLGALLEQHGSDGLERFDQMIDEGSDAEGAHLAGEILGQHGAEVGSTLRTDAGLAGPDDGSRALGLVTPFVLAALAQQQREQSLTAASVGALLIGERDERVTAASSAAFVPAAAKTPAVAEAQLAARALVATREEEARHEDEERRRRKYVWPFVALFAVAGVVLAIVLALTLGGDGDEPVAAAPEPAPAADAPAPAEPEPPAEPEAEPTPDLPTNVRALAEGAGNHATLLAMLEAAGLDSALRGEGPLTLLAPTDEAFAALPDGALDALLADPARLEELLSAHILEGEHFKDSLANRDEVTTPDGRSLAISANGADVSIGGAAIVNADQQAENGILHGLDGLALPDGLKLVAPPPRTLVDVAADQGQFTTLLDALVTANLTDTLESEGPFTLFAPTDAAFAALPDGVLDAIIADPAALEQLLTAHITGGVHDSEELASRGDLTMLTGQVLPTTADPSGLTVGSSAVTEPDVSADNGIMHVVDSVILPEGLALGADESVLDSLEAAGEFGTFLDLVERAGLTDTLRGPGPFTVFAFTDEAYASLPESVRARLDADPGLVAGVLGAHYAAGAAEATTIAAAEGFAVASGEEIGVVSDGELIWIGGSRIVETIDSGNAVVHVVDRVIIPPSFGAAEGTVNELLALAPVQFEVASAELTPAGARVLSRAVAYLRTNPVNVEIGGHTDSDGDAASNQALSEARALTVQTFLGEQGVDPALLSAVGYGATQPIASNDTDEGKARNRRIEFTILS